MCEVCLSLHVNMCQIILHRICKIHLYKNYQVQNKQSFEVHRANTAENLVLGIDEQY